MYLIRDGKIEFTGNKKQIIEYVKSAYEDEYWIQEYGKIFDKDYNKFKYCLENLGLYLSNRKPR